MTSGSWFFKLQREDLKRRLWAIALLFLAFFFAMPVGLAISMGNAANTGYMIYNDYTPFVDDGTLTAEEFAAKLLALKTKVVVNYVEFGNGLQAFLLITAAVVLGIAGFSYLHSRKKVDFYHSIPVRREMLFAVHYLDGILLTAAAFFINLCLTGAVAVSNGVPLPGLIGTAALSFGLNLLYFGIMYAVAVIAVMMTGNLVVSLLAVCIFFFFLPGMVMLLVGYCDEFFITAVDAAFTGEESLLMAGMRCLSPFSAYMVALSWDLEKISKYGATIFCTVFAFVALSLLALSLYRLRPSESAGKAMAFKRSMAPIRIVLVVGFGMAGGMFFWMLQSVLGWGIFGVLAAVILSHAVIEIIYNFDFKKLFSHKRQLFACLGAGVLLFLSFRYDWYGYDSYMPDAGKVASVSLDMSIDDSWLNWEYHVETEETPGGEPEKRLVNNDISELVQERMQLTDVDTALVLAEEGRRRGLAEREVRLTWKNNRYAYASDHAASAVSVIGGADGPTSVFVAGKVGTLQEEPAKEPQYFTRMIVSYRLTNGRTVKRSYDLYLSAVLSAYDSIYSQDAYKEGVYQILGQTAESISRVYYKEAGVFQLSTGDDGAVARLLAAYQEDLRGLTLETRLKENPVGAVAFLSAEVEEFVRENGLLRKSYRDRYYELKDDNLFAEFMCDYISVYPVYPSFTRTIRLLQEQGVEPGSYFTEEQVKMIRVEVEDLLEENPAGGINYPEGEELERLQKENPFYTEDAGLRFDTEEAIHTAMSALSELELNSMNGFRQLAGVSQAFVSWDSESERGATPAVFLQDKMTPQAWELFRGLPKVESGEVGGR